MLFQTLHFFKMFCNINTLQASIECFRRALSVSPNNAEILLNLARVLFNLQYLGRWSGEKEGLLAYQFLSGQRPPRIAVFILDLTMLASDIWIRIRIMGDLLDPDPHGGSLSRNNK